MKLFTWIRLLRRRARKPAGVRPSFRPLLEPVEGRIAPATLVVNTTDDANMGDSSLSLREAILLVNNAGDADAALGRALSGGESAQVSGAFGDNDTIEFQGGLSGTISLTMGELTVSTQAAIVGPGSGSLTIDAQGNSRVFYVAPGAQAAVSGLTLTGGNGTGAEDDGYGGAVYVYDGRLALTDVTFAGNTADSYGGALCVYSPTYSAVAPGVTVTDCTFTGNTGDEGGAIYLYDGSMAVTGCTIGGNDAGYGGGVYSEDGEMIVTDTDITNNDAEYDGGGIYNYYTIGSPGYNGMTLVGVTVSGNMALDGDGGGIYNYYGAELRLFSTTVSENTASDSGGGIYNYYYNSDYYGRAGAYLTDSHVDGNMAGEYGGGIYSYDYSRLVVTDSSVSGNTAGYDGGGIYSEGNYYYGGAGVFISGSDVSRNEARDGGAIYNYDASKLDITASTFTDNTASGDGGAVYNYYDNYVDGYNTAVTVTASTFAGNHAGGDGGAFYSEDDAELRISNSTISSNTADGSGGGLYQADYTARLWNVTLTGNRADADGDSSGTGGGIYNSSDDTVLFNTIVAGNFAGTGTTPDDISLGLSLPSVQGSHNLIGDAGTSGGLVDGEDGNIVGVGGSGTIDITTILDPTLADNGGPTLTHALVGGSPAINAGSDALARGTDAGSPLFTDQRGTGFNRIVDRVDIGAFEAQSASPVDDTPPPSPTPNFIVDISADESDGNTSAGDLSLREAVEMANMYGSGVIAFDSSLNGMTIDLTLGELAITGEVTIIGPGSGSLTIDAQGNSRIFYIAPGADAAISGLTLTGGNGTGADDDGYGGAVYAYESRLALTDVTFAANTADDYGGALCVYSPIYSASAPGVTVTDCTFSGNTGDEGGAIYLYDGFMTVTGCTIDGNDAGYYGGGIYSEYAEMIVTDTDITNNDAEYDGGGIYNYYTIGSPGYNGMTLVGVTVSGNMALDGDGGGIYNYYGAELRLFSTTVSENTASDSGGGIYNYYYNSDYYGRAGAYLTDSHVDGNMAGEYGGGIYSYDYSRLVVTDSSVSGNTAGYDGGGIYSEGNYYYGGAGVFISGSDVSRNEARDGGAIYNYDASKLDITASTFTDNTASGDGGAVYNYYDNYVDGYNTAVTVTASTFAGNHAGGDGGAFYSEDDAELRISNSTISSNTADGSGGGLYQADYTARLWNVTLTGNRADADGDSSGTGGGIYNGSDDTVLFNTIVAGNFAGTGITPDDIGLLAMVMPVVQGSHNLIGDAGTSGGLVDGEDGNIVGVGGSGTIDITTILDTTLADNGGPTPTHALVSGSPAINAGSDALARGTDAGSPLFTDQRGTGYHRISGSSVDIGAFEQQVSVAVPPTVVKFEVLYGTGLSYDLLANPDRVLPWRITGIRVTFSTAVTAAEDALVLAGPGGQTFSGFTGSGTDTLIWTFTTPLEAANLTATLSSAAVTGAGGAHLDGDPDAAGADDFVHGLRVLYGDVTGDGVVTSLDAVQILARSRGLTVPTADLFLDVDGDGDVDTADFNAARGRSGTTLP